MIFYLALIKKENYFTNKSLSSVYLRRQDILDRNSNLLARNVKLYSAAIRPRFVTDEGKLLINLRLIFPNMNMDRIKKKIKGRVFSLVQGASGNKNYLHWVFDILPKIKICSEVYNLENIENFYFSKFFVIFYPIYKFC